MPYVYCITPEIWPPSFYSIFLVAFECLATLVGISFVILNLIELFFFRLIFFVFAPTIFHMLCLTDTAIRRGPLIGILREGKGSQPGACGALAAWRLRLVKATVVAALQRALVRVLGLAHHRERHSAEWLQENRVLRVTGLRSPKMQGRFISFKEDGRILRCLAGS